MEPIRVRGIVRRVEPGDGPVLLRVLVRSDTARIGRVDRFVPFDLEPEDASGRRIRVEPGKVRLEPMIEERERWAAIEDDPDLASLRERAPGPHVKVTIERAAIREGDRVVVAGEPLEHAFDEATARPREPPVRRLTRVRAVAIATGPDAEALVDRALRGNAKRKKKDAKPIERPRLRLDARVVLAAAGALLAIAAFAIPLSPVKVDVAAWAASLFATGAALATAARMPRFVHGGAPVAKLADSHGKILATAAVAVLSFVVFPTFGDAVAYGSARQPPVNGSMVAVVLVAVQIAVQLGVLAIGTRRIASLLRVLLRAPLWGPGHLDATWGATEGTVRDPTPVTVDGAPHALANVIEREVREGSAPDIVVEKVLNAGTFFVESDDGSFEVDPTRATWASIVRLAGEKKTTDVVPIGGTVLVAGRATRETPGLRARLAQGGPESLVFLATPRGTSARARARSALEARWVGLVVLAACLVALVVTASSLEPQLPAFYIEGH